MASIYDIASFYIDLSLKNEDDHMTNLKLNKLVYYAQGCHLERTGNPLFHEDIEAWRFGPVVSEVYHKYKVHGDQPIPCTDDDYSPSVFSSEEIETLIDVMREFGCYTGFTLVKKTHAPGSPWDKAYKTGSSIIDISDIKEHFQRHPVPRFSFNEVPVIEELPNGWYDPSEDAVWEAYL